MTGKFRIQRLGWLVLALAMGYLVGVRQASPKGPPKTYKLILNVFGHPMQLQLGVGVLGIAIILILVILLVMALLLASLASRRARQAEAAGLRLRAEVGERERAQDAARSSQALVQAIAENSPAAIFIKDLAGRYLLINRRCEELFHVQPGEIRGRTDEYLFPRETAEAMRAAEQSVLAAGTALETEEERLDQGSPRTWLSVRYPLRNAAGEVYAICGIATDITERKRAEQALRESEERYRALAESAPHLVWTCNPEGECDYLSQQWADYTGLPAEGQLGNGWAEQLHPEDRNRVQQAWADAVASGDQFEAEYRIRRADGVYRWFKTRATPLRDADGRVVKWFGSSADFDEQKRGQQKLQDQLGRLNLLDQITRAIAQRQDLQSVFQVVITTLEENLPIDFGCICQYDALAEPLTVSCAGSRGAALAEAMGMTPNARIGIDQNGLSRCVNGQLVYEPDVSQVDFPFPRRLTKGGLRSLVMSPLASESSVFGILVAARRTPEDFSSADCEFLRQLSGHIALAAHQAQIYTALQQAYDELRQTQQAVMQQERLRALGQMASGIAHDINNALSPVALYTDALLDREPNLSPRTREYLETTQRAIDDVAHTVARMRDFYRQREPELMTASVDVNQLVQQVLDLTRARWSDMPQQRGIVIEMRSDLAADLPPIAGSESEIREALTNLIFNAVDAMPDGGTLTVRTRSVVGLPTNGGSPRVQLDVVDTGIGMNEETRRRCLEPFFTTKGERGTGLGLAMVYGLAQRHNADLEIESELGKGATVRLSFTVPATAAEPSHTVYPPPLRSRLRILIVDDDPIVIKSLRDTLEADGHAVTTASGGREGIDTFRMAEKRGEPFAVVITDLGMPYVDGRKVADAVKGAAPATPVILLTGWGQRLTDEHDVPRNVDRVLNKPPRIQQLRSALAELTVARRMTAGKVF